MRAGAMAHQYVDRDTGSVVTERLLADAWVNLLYGGIRENAAALFRLLTSSRASAVLGWLHYDRPLANPGRMIRALKIDPGECLDPIGSLDTARKLFERKIRYWQIRPMPDGPETVVSPADARVLVGSLGETPDLRVKGKLFCLKELLGPEKTLWRQRFAGGDFAVCRLTPDKYHYNHVPAAGTVVDFYEIDGAHHACNPGAAISLPSPYSKNRRTVTVIDTDVHGGTGVGLVALIEIVALMIGRIRQCYSPIRYDDPVVPVPGMMFEKGAPKSLYRPGSSTDVVLFEPGRIRFCDDLRQNVLRLDVRSRFSHGFGRPLVETDVRVRSAIALRAHR